MRKLMFLGLITAMLAPAAVSAQSAAEVRDSRRDVRQEQRELQNARQYGDRGDIREERRDVQDARQELREDIRDRRQAYVAPYRGWTYRPVQQGIRLQPGFYGQRYIITNPRVYGVQPASRNRQWIRYGNDLLLVNVRNGRVIQIVRRRF